MVISAIVVYSKQLRDLNIFGNILVIEKKLRRILTAARCFFNQLSKK